MFLGVSVYEFRPFAGHFVRIEIEILVMFRSYRSININSFLKVPTLVVDWIPSL